MNDMYDVHTSIKCLISKQKLIVGWVSVCVCVRTYFECECVSKKSNKNALSIETMGEKKLLITNGLIIKRWPTSHPRINSIFGIYFCFLFFHFNQKNCFNPTETVIMLIFLFKMCVRSAMCFYVYVYVISA